MNLTLSNPFGDLLARSWWDDLLRPNWVEAGFNLVPESGADEYHERTFHPPVDVFEKGGRLNVVVEIPGVRREDLSLELRDGILYLTGTRRRTEPNDGETIRRLERVHGRFHRHFHLPEGVTENDIKAEYRDGLLLLTMPARTEAVGRKIPIQSP